MWRRRPARIVAHVSTSGPHDPIASLNQALSEVIDEVQDLKQARWRVTETHPLHAVLDQLFDDLRGWARLLIERDEALGVSPLSSMPSVAGRTPPNQWPGTVSEDDVRRIVGEHLDRLQQHVAAAEADQEEDSSRAALAEVERGLSAHQRALTES
jgi:DNA-binding ferritin-like protein